MQKFTHPDLLFTIIAAFQKPKNDYSVKNGAIDFTTAMLKVNRGTFHADTFVLKDTTIIFYPEKEMDSVEHQDYYTTSEQPISKDDRDLFFIQKKIVAIDIWDLKEKYTPDESCTSKLTVTFSLNNKVKKIVCNPFDRGCFAIAKFIESEMVRLHGKGLKRIFLSK